MKEIIFTIEGACWGKTVDVKRGVKIKFEDNMSPEEYLMLYKQALDALYEHEVVKVNQARKYLEDTNKVSNS